MTIEQIDTLLGCLIGKPKKRKALRYWYDRMMRMKGPITGWRGVP